MHFYYGETPSVRASSRPANHQLVLGAVLANGECEGGGTSSRRGLQRMEDGSAQCEDMCGLTSLKVERKKKH